MNDATIVALAADVYGLRPDHLRRTYRKKAGNNAKRAKATACLLMREIYKMTFAEIAADLGWKDQSSASQAYHEASGWRFSQMGYRLMLQTLEAAVRTRGESEFVHLPSPAALPF